MLFMSSEYLFTFINVPRANSRAGTLALLRSSALPVAGPPSAPFLVIRMAVYLNQPHTYANYKNICFLSITMRPASFTSSSVLLRGFEVL